MNFVRYVGFPLVSGAALLAAMPAMAASDVSNSGAVSNQAVTAVAAPIASAQTASLISGAIGGAISGGVGGGFTGGGAGGGFSPSGGAVPGPTSQLMNSRQSGKAGAAGAPKLGVWAQGTYVNIDKKEAFLGMDGDVYNLVGGIDYKFNDRGVVGVSIGYENTKLDTKFNNGTFEGNGYTVAPYVGYALSPNWTADLTVGHTWLDYDVSRNNDSVKGSYEATRWFTAANLTGNFAVDRWRLSPKVGVSYMREESDNYRETGTSTAAVEGSTIKFGRASAGVKAGYVFQNFMPYAKVTGEYDFEKPDAVLKSNGQMSNVDDGGLVFGLGVDIFKGPVSGSIEASYNSALRDDLDIWQGTARIRYEF